MKDQPITAALVLIGNELLSGRTCDANMPFIAHRLTKVGIQLTEVRVIPDVAEIIARTVNELRRQVNYLFTTGGIGPTHDDITAGAIALAFRVPLIQHPEAARRLMAYFQRRGVEPNEARMRMANTPQGAELIDNPVSAAPGFRIDNVFVLAGVPKIMQAMLEQVLPKLEHGSPILSETVICDLPEGQIAAGLGEIQRRYTTVDIGSYPGKSEHGYRVSVVVRGRSRAKIIVAAEEIMSLISHLGGHASRATFSPDDS